MAMSEYPSKLSLPQTNPGVVTVLDYLIIKFPYINEQTWRRRMTASKVHWHDGSLINATTRFQPQQRVYYYREVNDEPQIPFQETTHQALFELHPVTGRTHQLRIHMQTLG